MILPFSPRLQGDLRIGKDGHRRRARNDGRYSLEPKRNYCRHEPTATEARAILDAALAKAAGGTS